VLLPVEVKGDAKDWNPEELSWEMIVSAMLKIMAYDREHGNFSYYRDFVLAARPEIIRELSTAGIVKAEAKEYALAREIFLAMEGIEPENPRIKLNLALVHDQWAESLAGQEDSPLTLKVRSSARDYYHEACDGDEPLPDAFFYLAYFHIKGGDLEKAISNLETFLTLAEAEDNKRDEAQKTLANLKRQARMDELFKESYDFILLGQEEKGIERIQEFLQVHPQVWNAWFLLGWGRRRLGLFAEARDAFEESVKWGGNQVDVLNELSICNMELGDFAASRKHLETALKVEPENVKIMSNLGILALKEGNKDLAQSFFESILVYEPEDPLALQYLEELGNE